MNTPILSELLERRDDDGEEVFVWYVRIPGEPQRYPLAAFYRVDYKLFMESVAGLRARECFVAVGVKDEYVALLFELAWENMKPWWISGETGQFGAPQNLYLLDRLRILVYTDLERIMRRHQ